MGTNSKPRGRATAKAALNRTIDEHMNRQAGLVGHVQLTELGLSSERIRTRLESGELVLRTTWPDDPKATERMNPRKQRLRPYAAYARSSEPLDLEAVRWRAILSAPPGARLGGTSGCSLLDLERHRGTTMHVYHPGGDWHPPHGVKRHRTTFLPDVDLLEIRGLPTMSTARCVFDAAEERIEQDRLDELLDRAIEIRLYDEMAMRRVVAERPRMLGSRELDAALDRLDDKSGEFRSAFERRTVRLIQESSVIPAVAVNVLVDDFRPDIHVIGTRAIIECDGRDYHRSLAQIVADERREEILRARGFVFLRLRWAQVRYDEQRTLRRIEQFVLANLAPPIPHAA